MKIIRYLFIDDSCYFRLESQGLSGLKSVVKVGDMFILEWYNDNIDEQQIINKAIEELKLRAKISSSHRTLYNIERLLPKIENLKQTSLELF